MTIIQILVLAIVQGLTEFLPISSSGHLILTPELLGWKTQSLAFDVAVHVGSLIAVMGYFRQDLARLLTQWALSIGTRTQTADSRLAWLIIFASIPVAIGGLLLHKYADTIFRSPLVIAWATIGFGILLFLADRFGQRVKSIEQLGSVHAILIGASQVLAMVPGTSRSGITMTAALFFGYDRQTAARFSFLLSIPTILMAGTYKGISLMSVPEVPWADIFSGIVLSGLSAYICIHFFLKLLDKIGMLPFVIYRILLGVFLLYIFW